MEKREGASAEGLERVRSWCKIKEARVLMEMASL